VPARTIGEQHRGPRLDPERQGLASALAAAAVDGPPTLSPAGKRQRRPPRGLNGAYEMIAIGEGDASLPSTRRHVFSVDGCVCSAEFEFAATSCVFRQCLADSSLAKARTQKEAKQPNQGPNAEGEDGPDERS
jgi:hypothetical protein